MPRVCCSRSARQRLPSCSCSCHGGLRCDDRGRCGLPRVSAWSVAGPCEIRRSRRGSKRMHRRELDRRGSRTRCRRPFHLHCGLDDQPTPPVADGVLEPFSGRCLWLERRPPTIATRSRRLWMSEAASSGLRTATAHPPLRSGSAGPGDSPANRSPPRAAWSFIASPRRCGRERIDGVYSDGWSGPTPRTPSTPRGPARVSVDVGRAGWGGPDAEPGHDRGDGSTTGSRVAARWVVQAAMKRTFRLRAPARHSVSRSAWSPRFRRRSSARPDPRQLGFRSIRSGRPHDHHADETNGTRQEAITSELWGRKARERSSRRRLAIPLLAIPSAYLPAHQPVDHRQRRRSWLAFAKRRLLPHRTDRGLSLGCRNGGLERDAISIGMCGR